LQIREFQESDLDEAVRLWEDATACGVPPVFHVGEAVAAVLAGEPAFAAVD
jgi:hypothetical protein